MRIGIVLLATLSFNLFGCGKSVEDNCATYCEKGLECNPSDADATPEGVERCKTECKADLEDADGDCQDAFGDYADCVDDASCSDFEGEDANECSAEMLTFVGECESALSP